MSIGLIGRKIGMTRIYDEKGVAVPVTVIEADGNRPLQVKTSGSDGYSALQVGFDEQKESRVNGPLLGHFVKAGAKPCKIVREFRCAGDDEVDGEVNLSVTRFQPGQFVDIIGRSKGKGFQGVMRRHNFGGQEREHGSMTHRRPGAVGQGATPARIWKNQKMPGHQGDQRITVQNLRVVQVREDDGVLLVSGAIPGARGSYVIVRPAKKKPAPASDGGEA